MSAAKMVADSTQSDTDSRKNRHKSASRKEKKSKKEKRRRRYSSSSSRSRSRSRSRTRSSSPDSRRTRSKSRTHSGSEEYDSDIDLQKQLKPLGAYLKTPAGLLDQMLHSVRGSSLQRALPDILKSMPIEELRKRCLEHLEVLSRKRMKRILAGDDPQTISSSGTDDDSTEEEEGEKDTGAENKADSTGEEGKDREPGVVVKTEPPDSPHRMAAEEFEESGQHEQHHPPPSQHQDMEQDEEGEGEEEEGEMEEEDDEEEEEEGEWGEEGGQGGEDVAEALFPEVEQDRMDLLELEMRARAIKAMLALHEQREKSSRVKVTVPLGATPASQNAKPPSATAKKK